MASLLQEYKKRLKSSYDQCTPHWNRAIDNYKHYLGRLDTGGESEANYPFGSKMSVPVSYEIVETVMPRIIGKDPEFTTVAVETSDIPYEQTAKMALDLAYNNPKLELLGEPIYLKLQRFVKELLITGNSVLRPYWRRETIKQTRYLASLERAGIKDSEDIQALYKKAEQMGVTDEVRYSKKLVDAPFIDDFDARHLPFFMFMPDVPMIETGRMRYKIERDWMTFEELASEALKFGYDKAVMDELATLVRSNRSGFTPELTKDFLQTYNDLFDNKAFSDQTFSTDNDKIPLLIVDKMWMGDKVAVFVNEKYHLTPPSGMRNPYDIMRDPFVYGHDVVIPHSYFSYGEIDSIKKLEDGATDILNMRFDNLVQSMLNFWLVNPNLMDSTDEFVPIPNSVTAVQDVDKAVRVINGNNVTATAYKEVEEILALIQRTSGTQDYVKGAEGETLAGRTYGGLRLVQEMANARFIIKSRLFEKVTLKSLGYFMLEFSRQFINKDRVTRQFGEVGIVENKIKASDLKSIRGIIDMKIIPNSTKVIDEQAEAVKINALADRFTTGAKLDKGPFSNIPDAVYDKFMLKYLPLYGVTDAVYWVRMIKEEREKKLKALEKTQKDVATKTTDVKIPPSTVPTLQSDQIANQPDPLTAIINGANLPAPPAQ